LREKNELTGEKKEDSRREHEQAHLSTADWELAELTIGLLALVRLWAS